LIVRNFLHADSRVEQSHRGKGRVKNVKLFSKEDFETPLKFLYYTEIEPGCSIGVHKHGEDEEIYVILEGGGLMTVNGETRAVQAGDVILNKPHWSHGLENNSDVVLKILVFEADKVTGADTVSGNSLGRGFRHDKNIE